MLHGNEHTDEQIRSLIQALSSDSPMKRVHAANSLEQFGKATIPFLSQALTDPRDTVRWEAAKVLTRMHEPIAAPALVRALEDVAVQVMATVLYDAPVPSLVVPL